MFDDRSRPLYMLCDRINIDRISEQDYVNYLNGVARKTWKKNLDQAVINEIFKLTERHPYYLNALCDKLWSSEENSPTVIAVQKVWNDYVLQEESKIAKELSSLNTSQKKILIVVAQGISKDLTSKRILHKFNLTSAAVIKSLNLVSTYNNKVATRYHGQYLLHQKNQI